MLPWFPFFVWALSAGSIPAPRVNKSMLPGFVGKEVSLVCRGSLLAGTCSVTACDNQATTVHVAPGTPSPQTTFVEVIGAVQPDLSIIASKVVAFGDSLDMETYNEMVTLAQGKFVALFA